MQWYVRTSQCGGTLPQQHQHQHQHPRAPFEGRGVQPPRGAAFSEAPKAQTKTFRLVKGPEENLAQYSNRGRGVGRGGWHVAFGVLLASAAGGAHWPIATYCPSLGHCPSVGGGAHRPRTAPSLPFPSVGCANGAPGLSLFHCSVSSPHGG